MAYEECSQDMRTLGDADSLDNEVDWSEDRVRGNGKRTLIVQGVPGQGPWLMKSAASGCASIPKDPLNNVADGSEAYEERSQYSQCSHYRREEKELI